MIQQISRPVPCILQSLQEYSHSYCLQEYSHPGHKQHMSYYYQLLSTGVQPSRPQTAHVLLLSATVYRSTAIQATNSTCLIIISYCLQEYSHPGHKQHMSYYYQLLSTGVQPSRPQTAHVLLLSATVYRSTAIQATNSTCLIIISYCLQEYSHTGHKQHMSYYYQLLSTGIQPYRPQIAPVLLLSVIHRKLMITVFNGLTS